MQAPRSIMAWPAWLFFIAFFLIPVAVIVVISFGYKPDIFSTYALGNWSFDNYRTAFDPVYAPTLTNTLRVALIGTLICLIVALPFSYWLAVRVSPRWRGLLLGLVLVPFWTNFLVRTIGWQLIISPNGFASDFMQDIGLIDRPLELLYTRGAVQLGVVYNYLPLMILPLFVAFDRLDPAMREASKDLGANRFKTFLQVSLPLAMPGIVAGMLLVFIPLMGDYITAEVLGGAKGNMLGQLVAVWFGSGQNWPVGSATAVLLMALILLTVAVFGALGLILRSVLRARRRVEIVVKESA
jgi:spermidine/putrescine transport system permease protein